MNLSLNWVAYCLNIDDSVVDILMTGSYKACVAAVVTDIRSAVKDQFGHIGHTNGTEAADLCQLESTAVDEIQTAPKADPEDPSGMSRVETTIAGIVWVVQAAPRQD